MVSGLLAGSSCLLGLGLPENLGKQSSKFKRSLMQIKTIKGHPETSGSQEKQGHFKCLIKMKEPGEGA